MSMIYGKNKSSVRGYAVAVALQTAKLVACDL